jgi:hypothetical protein
MLEAKAKVAALFNLRDALGAIESDAPTGATSAARGIA